MPLEESERQDENPGVFHRSGDWIDDLGGQWHCDIAFDPSTRELSIRITDSEIGRYNVELTNVVDILVKRSGLTFLNPYIFANEDNGGQLYAVSTAIKDDLPRDDYRKSTICNLLREILTPYGIIIRTRG